MSQPGTCWLGLSGHGMLLSLVCPCRVAREPSGAVWISADGRGMVSVTPGARPARGTLDSLDVPAFVFPDGPKLEALSCDALDAAIMRVDAGVSDGPWTLIAPGFFLGIPVGLVVFSGTSADDRLPELHLRPAHLRGPHTIPDAFIGFEQRPVSVASIKMSGPPGMEEFGLEVDHGRVRVWEYAYQVEGAEWRKRHYGLSPKLDITLMMSAQAPLAEADRMFEAADSLAASFSPVR